MGRPTQYIKRIRELRKSLWPEYDFQHDLWNRKRSDGFITIPRTMPIIMDIIDDLSTSGPAGTTYLELWCRSYDEMYVSLSRSREIAFHSGFTGQRAERTWAEKIRMLDELGFISIREGQAGPLSHALILNPYHVIKRLYEEKRGVPKHKYNALFERALEIGATDLDDEEDTDEDTEATSKGSSAPSKTKATKAVSPTKRTLARTPPPKKKSPDTSAGKLTLKRKPPPSS